jgi:hypothetical protein
MRKAHLLLVTALAGPAWTTSALAQVSEAERAAARELFRQGDELQRASKFVDALDRFQRAQQVFSAPTNLLRIAECDAALGRLVESAEAYRAVLRTPLAGGTTPAFQAAVDQARAELEQVAPRVPRLVVEVQAPTGATNLQLEIDGQSVPAALIGEPIPLDPGPHKVLAFAPGFSSSEQQVELKEQEKKTVSFALTAIPGATPAPGAGVAAVASATTATGVASPPAGQASSTGTGGGVEAPKRSPRSLLLGAHLGFEVPSGQVPSGGVPTGGTGSPQKPADASSFGGGGLAYAFDGGIRFAGQWYLGVTLEHAQLGGGNLSGLPPGDTHASSNTTLLALVLGLVINPDRPSLYAEIGLGNRWFSYKEGSTAAGFTSASYTSGEFTLGAGVWIPVARAWRLIPKATLSLGSFGPPADDKSAANLSHGFFMLGLSGDYNADL